MNQKALDAITVFIRRHGNQWFEQDERMSLYLRRTRHCLGGAATECIDIANVEVREQYRQQGVFTAYLQEIETLAQENHLAVYVENIFHPQLTAFLLRRGYTRITGGQDICLYKKF